MKIPSEQLSDAKKLALLLVVMAALHAALAAVLPMNAGEAYYWLWGKYPAAGYFDHPPMVAWMSAIFLGWIDGVHLAARAGPMTLSILSTLAVYGLAREIFPGGQAAWKAALLYALTPIFYLNGVITQPDNSLILFSTLTWLFYWKAIRRETNLALWALAGAAAGLTLLSKFHAWVLLPGLWASPLFMKDRRKVFATAGPWLALVIALIVLSPNLIWNAQNDWMNYAYQWRRSDIPEAVLDPKYFAAYLVAPLLVLSPLVYVAILAGAWKGLRAWFKTGDDGTIFLLLAGAPLLLFLGALSFVVKISPHWPSSGYIPLLVLAVGLMERGELFGRRFERVMLLGAVAMLALVQSVPLWVMHLPDEINVPFRESPIEIGRPRREYVGWAELGAKAREMRDAMNENNATVIMAKNFHLISLLAFYSERPRECFALEKADAYNYEIWMEQRGGLAGYDAVVVIKKGKPNKDHRTLGRKYDKYHRFLDPLFERVEPAPSLVCYNDGAIEEYWGVDVSRPRLQEFLMFRCYGFKGRMAE